MSKSKSAFDRKKLEKLRKLSFFCIATVLLLVISGAAGYLLWFYKFRQLPAAPEVKLVLPGLRHGDIILRSGVGLWSELFRKYNRKDQRFSHVGIVVINNGNVRVLHSEGDDISGRGRVRFDTIETFVGASAGIGVSRLHSLDGAKMAAAAEKFYGRPFDWKFDNTDAGAIYCTELIDRALRQIAPGTSLELTDNIIAADACLDRRYFKEIPLQLDKNKLR